jgi:hypothetical protein
MAKVKKKNSSGKRKVDTINDLIQTRVGKVVVRQAVNNVVAEYVNDGLVGKIYDMVAEEFRRMEPDLQKLIQTNLKQRVPKMIEKAVKAAYVSF